MKNTGINIHLFSNWYIGSNNYEYNIYIKTIVKGEENKNYIGHYATIGGLLRGLIEHILKRRSKAKSIEELKKDIISIQTLIENLIKIIKEN